MTKGLTRSLSRGPVQKQPIIRQTIHLGGLGFNVTATGVANGFGSVPIGALPEGNILFLGAVAYVGLAGPGNSASLVDTWSGVFSMASAPLGNAIIDTPAEQDLIGATAVGPAVLEAVPSTRGSKTGVTLLDNTLGNLEVNLNLTITPAGITAGVPVPITAHGEVYLSYVMLGDS